LLRIKLIKINDMKKLYIFLSAAAFTAAATAQTNLVPNGGFETWTDGAPEGYTVTIPATGGSIAQETGTANVYGGTSSARFTAPAGTGNVRAAVTDIPVTAGHTYVLSYWFKDESDNARGRHWASWRAGADQLTNNLDVLQPDYFANTSGWQQVTHTLVAPATATAFRLDFRVYQETGNSGIIYYDDVVFYDQATASLVNEDIAGLKLFPNPLVAGGTLNITSNIAADKAVAIYDVLGKQVFNGSTVRGTVNTTDLKAGIYIVKIIEGDKTATRKLIVQ
jgi:hypothetical protein